ncbi:MAG: SulP family inorganic anion transporter [Flavobacteriales bacterium]|jgi:MFS superfamily sulfate permease-like transporter|nr:SulP family inorganic anion transporter [Flavobacteriales bacterium]
MSKNINSFLKDLPKNIFSGFVVSLIALPLGLGLAMASEAPPIAGVITAIIGGILVAILGGSHVTIAGPGNGLVGVLLLAITTLGLEGSYAAIIVSGLVLVLLGFLRMGTLSNYFPSSAIQGMLSAIGLIILGKQFHIMLGNKISRSSSIDYLVEIPNTLIGVFSYQDSGLVAAAIVGVLSLAIMVFYPKIRNKYLQLIPAPMWIVLLSIGMSYFYELVLNQPNPVHPDYMISGIPAFDQIITQIPTPDFSLTSKGAFWTSVVSLTLIASIESLLSIKAVDKLDPQKRRSNVNKDLKALGLATVGSGFLGGLNVVTVIARSSVNVNNGGTNRSSNFFHATFLVVFIILFSTQLTRIPLPALMAILVFTGYRLASPKVIKQIFTIGKEQLIIFFVTLFITLKVSLIVGISAGVFTTMIIHFVMNKDLMLFMRNILKPNVLMFKESGGNYYVSVKHFCTFMNYTKLKNKLDEIPEDQDVVVDFTMCHFVDHTVMENLHNYQELFEKKGGNFDVIGLDMHSSDSEHPFALRKIGDFITGSFTKRQNSISKIAEELDITYDSEFSYDTSFLQKFHFFTTKPIENIYNTLYSKDKAIKLFDITFSEGEFIAKEVVRTTMLYMKCEIEIPQFCLDREGFLSKVYPTIGFEDVNFKNYPAFSKRFFVLGNNCQELENFFGEEIVQFLEQNDQYHIESNGEGILVFGKERLAGAKEIKQMLSFGKELIHLVNQRQVVEVY